MIYEFIGLGGAGKTYRAAEYAKTKNIPLVSILNSWERSLYAFLFMARHPIVVARLVWWVIQQGQTVSGLIFHKIFFLLFRTLGREGKILFLDDAVIDEGLVQFIISLFEEPVSAKDIKNYIQLILSVAPRQIYILDTPILIRQERMTHRRRIPRSIFGTHYGIVRNKTLEINYPIIVKCLLQDVDAEIVSGI